MRPTLVPDGRKVPPDGAVREEPVTLEFRREEALAESQRLRLVGALHPRRAPRLVPRLHDEGRHPRLVLIGVDAPETMLVVLEVEREGRKGLRGAEPNEPVRPEIDARLEVVAMALAEGRVDAVGDEDEVGAAERRVVADLDAVAEVDADVATAVGEDGEQGLSGEAREA